MQRLVQADKCGGGILRSRIALVSLDGSGMVPCSPKLAEHVPAVALYRREHCSDLLLCLDSSSRCFDSSILCIDSIHAGDRDLDEISVELEQEAQCEEDPADDDDGGRQFRIGCGT